jgi:hypothetical protein
MDGNPVFCLAGCFVKTMPPLGALAASLQAVYQAL